MTYRLGLDFGTTFSAAAITSGGATRVCTLGNRSSAVPSALFVREDGTMLHGEDAYLRGGSEPERLVRNLKRRLGDGSRIIVAGRDYAAEDLVASYLRWAVDVVVEREGGLPTEIVLSHPASWRSFKLDAFRDAVARAGLTPVQYVSEPVAAALHHATEQQFSEGQLIGVYDLGGGTFDAAVLGRTGTEFGLIGEPEGEDHLGGVDFDEVMFHLVQTKLGGKWTQATHAGGGALNAAIARLQRECTAAKEALSIDDQVEISIALPGLNDSVVVSRREFEQYLDPSVSESIGAFRRAVAGAQIEVNQLTAVLLVGGSTEIPLVRQRLAEEVGQIPLLTSDPKHAVARGASLHGGHQGSGVLPVAPPPAPVKVVAVPPPAMAPPSAAASLQPIADQSGPAVVAGSQPAYAAGGEPPLVQPETARSSGARSKLPLILGAAVLAAVALTVGILALSRGGNEPNSPLINDPQDTTEGAGGGDTGESAGAAASLPSPEGMVQVPAGPYLLGLGGGSAETAAERTVDLEAVHLDQFEVTNAQYQQFVQFIGAPEPTSWPQGKMPDDLADHPVRGVEQVWAETYCQALSKRLPTEAEWEAGGRGPAGQLFPWGDDPSVVDLDGLLSQPVGGIPENVSPLNVHDTVGSAWEWVGEPYDAVAAGEVVRRGGEYGRVREGIAMRQVVAANNASTINETGFRCAATAVDEATPPQVFNKGGELPEEMAAEERPPLTDGVLVDEHFDQPSQFGFPEEDTEITRRGLHSPWYHVEASKAEIQAVSLGGFNFADAIAETQVFVDNVELPEGVFRYGLVVRASGELRSPRAGGGNLRPTNFYALLINPITQQWEFVHDDSLPLRSVASGPVPGSITGVDALNPASLKVEMEGNILRLFVNDEQVDEYDTKGFHTFGDIGFFVESFDQTKAHVHFESLKVTPLEGN